LDELISYAVPALTAVPMLRASCEQQYGNVVLYEEFDWIGSDEGATGIAPNSVGSGAGRPPNALPGIQRPIVGTSSPKVLYSVMSMDD